MRAAISIMPSMGNITSIKAPLFKARAWALAASVILAGCASTPPVADGTFLHPLGERPISSGFGQRNGRPHYGIDMSAPSGTPIVAAASGRVSFAGRQRGFGRIVILEHGDGLETYYAHMKGFAVRKGKKVRQGQTIGYVGASGNATGPHLHFEVRAAGQPLDPQKMLRR